jgi:hypothetical protein
MLRLLEVTPTAEGFGVNGALGDVLHSKTDTTMAVQNPKTGKAFHFTALVTEDGCRLEFTGY